MPPEPCRNFGNAVREDGPKYSDLDRLLAIERRWNYVCERYVRSETHADGTATWFLSGNAGRAETFAKAIDDDIERWG